MGVWQTDGQTDRLRIRWGLRTERATDLIDVISADLWVYEVVDAVERSDEF